MLMTESFSEYYDFDSIQHNSTIIRPSISYSMLMFLVFFTFWLNAGLVIGPPFLVSPMISPTVVNGDPPLPPLFNQLLHQLHNNLHSRSFAYPAPSPYLNLGPFLHPPTGTRRIIPRSTPTLPCKIPESCPGKNRYTRLPSVP